MENEELKPPPPKGEMEELSADSRRLLANVAVMLERMVDTLVELGKVVKWFGTVKKEFAVGTPQRAKTTENENKEEEDHNKNLGGL